MQTTDFPITFEITIKASITEVWQALTHLPTMKRWYFDQLPAFEAKVGFTTQFLNASEEREFTHVWTVIEAVHERIIAYSWTFLEYPGTSVTTFSLAQNRGNTILSFEAKVLESFPADIPEFRRESGLAGWNYFLNDRLKVYLESKQ